MTKILKNLFKIQPQSREITSHYFEITSLSFKTRTKNDVFPHSGKTTCDILIVFVGNVRLYSQFCDW